MPTEHEIIAAHYAASDAGDIDGMLAPLTPTTRWTEAAGFVCGGTYLGPAAVREHVFERIAREFDDYAFRLESLLDAGEAQVGVGTYTGVCRATGKGFRARVTHVWHLADGRVTSFEQFVDSAEVAAAMH